jgi:hypothetical protein
LSSATITIFIWSPDLNRLTGPAAGKAATRGFYSFSSIAIRTLRDRIERLYRDNRPGLTTAHFAHLFRGQFTRSLTDNYSILVLHGISPFAGFHEDHPAGPEDMP